MLDATDTFRGHFGTKHVQFTLSLHSKARLHHSTVACKGFGFLRDETRIYFISDTVLTTVHGGRRDAVYSLSKLLGKLRELPALPMHQGADHTELRRECRFLQPRASIP